MKYYYTTPATQRFISSKDKKVYIYGGCMGVGNFGDIIQLKNTIHYYRSKYNMEPVLFFLTNYIEGKNHVQKYYRQYDCENIIFVSNYLVDASAAGIEPLRKLGKGGFLHIHGGGYLNSKWGKGHLDRIQSILETFEIAEYVFSGQQVDEEIIPLIQNVFNTHVPLLFGARDYQSYELIKGILPKDRVEFSFDDVTETFLGWRDSASVHLRTRLINKLRPSNILWHINLSYYSNGKWDVIDKLNAVKEIYPTQRAIVAQAYSDIRALQVIDGVSALVQLKEQFPYTDYRVYNFVSLAYQINLRNNYYPRIAEYLDHVTMAISCSYHLALLFMLFDIPAYLTSPNPYYSQKQKGLGINVSFEEFINKPANNTQELNRHLSARKAWIDVLDKVVDRFLQQDIDTKEVHIQKDVDTRNAQKLRFLTKDSQ